MNLGNVYLKGATLLALVLSGLRDAGMVRWGGGWPPTLTSLSLERIQRNLAMVAMIDSVNGSRERED